MDQRIARLISLSDEAAGVVAELTTEAEADQAFDPQRVWELGELSKLAEGIATRAMNLEVGELAEVAG